MVRSYQPPKQGKVLDRSSIFFARSYLLVLNSSLLHRPFLYSTVRCETDRSHFPQFAVRQTVLILHQFAVSF